jgi:hypothetical protein
MFHKNTQALGLWLAWGAPSSCQRHHLLAHYGAPFYKCGTNIQNKEANLASHQQQFWWNMNPII